MVAPTASPSFGVSLRLGAGLYNGPDVAIEIVGVDEAGYGPLLGPLVVAAVALRVPDVASCPWQLLADEVTATPRARDPRLPVADSKLVFRGRGTAALARLELTVLAFLRAAGARPRTWNELLDAVAPALAQGSLAEPWYRAGGFDVPLAVAPDDVARAADRLATGMGRAGVEIASVRCDVVGESRFNAAVAALDNKAELLFEVAAALVGGARTAATRRIVVDRQGGRSRYAEPLRRAFPEAFVWIAGEQAAASAYRLSDSLGECDLSFEVGADRRHFAVALASMVAKYVRELCMEGFNRYWAERVPGIVPTAGYWSDGQRFLADLADAAEVAPVGELPVPRCR